MRVLAVVNSRAGDDRDAGGRALSMLSARGVSVEQREASDEREVDRIIRQARDVDAVVLGGGDGTLSLALPALLERGLPLGVLPLGTANDFARSVGVEGVESACGAIAAGRTRTVDIGMAGDVPFLNAAAIGVPAAAARELTASLKRQFGMLATAAAAPNIARRAQAFGLSMRVDGAAFEQPHTVAALVTVGRFLGGIPVEYSDLDDGRLHVLACRSRSPFDAVSLALSALTGRMHRNANVAERSGRVIELQTSAPMEIAIDGDVRAKTPLAFAALPRALRVFSPEA
jgi:YegS/Rv2252/BmrU family lipid kinase